MSHEQHSWLDAPEHLVLADREVHVWRSRLDQGEVTVRKLSELLSPDELLRADRFHFSRDRDHFIAARGSLRVILSRYVHVAPRLLVFSFNQYGKLAMCGPAGVGLLQFNVSHSHGIALYAVAWGREVGVGVEFVREDFASFEIAERFFSPREVSALRALPPGARALAFFNCWTRKEA